MKSRERNEWSDAVARQIKAERAAASLTQKQVSQASGIPEVTYKRLESGARVAASDQLAAILGALRIPMSTFYARVEERIIAEMHLSPAESADLWAAIARRSPSAPSDSSATRDNTGRTGT